MVQPKISDAEILDDVASGKTGSEMAKQYGVTERSIRRRMAKMRETHPDMIRAEQVRATLRIPGVDRASINFNADSQVTQSWLKVKASEQEKAEALEHFANGLCAKIPQPKTPKIPRLKYRKDIMPSIFIGDAHIGMYAYGPETTHSDFDTGIATRQLRDAFDYLVDRAEPAEQGLLVDVGDFTHANSSHDMTYAGTKVDVDTRFHKVMKEAALTMKYAIDRMLTKFKTVTVVVARGNHNTDAAAAIQLMLEFHYDKNKRVNILPTEGFYHYIEYGKWLIGVTHGDKQKPEALASSMARDMAQAWGRTTHRMWATGHFHKEAVKTLPGCKHKVFAALPPPDAWHASHGFMGDGEMEMMTFRKDGGLHSSHVYNIPRPIIEPDCKI